MAHAEWIPHTREDGERVGWMLPRGEGFIVIDLLGRERTGVLDWFAAEEYAEALGIGFLADIHLLTLPDGRELRVRIAEVSPSNVRVKEDDGGAVGAPQIYYDLGFPAPETLRPL